MCDPYRDNTAHPTNVPHLGPGTPGGQGLFLRPRDSNQEGGEIRSHASDGGASLITVGSEAHRARPPGSSSSEESLVPQEVVHCGLPAESLAGSQCKPCLGLQSTPLAELEFCQTPRSCAPQGYLTQTSRQVFGHVDKVGGLCALPGLSQGGGGFLCLCGRSGSGLSVCFLSTHPG